LSVALRHSFDSFNSFNFFNLDIFDFSRSFPENSIAYDFITLARALPLLHVQERRHGGGAMSLLLVFIHNGYEAFRVLRYRNGFGMLDSVRYGLWLAHK
jgi:hypothetical protein